MSDQLTIPEPWPASWAGPVRVAIRLCVDGRRGTRQMTHLLTAWHSGAFEKLGGGLLERLRSQPSQEVDLTEDFDGSILREPAGTVAMEVAANRRGSEQLSFRWLTSGGAWPAFLDELDRLPDISSMSLWVREGAVREHSTRERSVADRPGLAVYASVDETNYWLQLNVGVGRRFLVQEIGQDLALAFLRAVAEEADPTFGQIGEDHSSIRTPLEEALGRSLDGKEANRQARTVLRGYSWVTILAQELGDRLGGLDALVGSGAFVEVAQLANGGYWTRATETIEEFGLAAAERVFEVVRPVLPPGLPKPPAYWQPTRMVVLRDAQGSD